MWAWTLFLWGVCAGYVLARIVAAVESILEAKRKARAEVAAARKRAGV